MMTELEKYYNKFNEEKRLGSRHGQVEFTTSMKYIHEYLPKDKSAKILDVAIHSINLILINYALSNMMAFFRSSLLYILFFTSEMWVFVQYRKNIEELSDSKALANLLLIICVAIEIGLLYFFGIVSGELIPFEIKW